MVISSCSYDQPSAYVFLEFLALYEFTGSDIQHKGAVGLFEHGIDPVDSDVTVLGGFPDGQHHFQVDGDFADFFSLCLIRARNRLSSGTVTSILFDGCQIDIGHVSPLVAQ